MGCEDDSEGTSGGVGFKGSGCRVVYQLFWTIVLTTPSPPNLDIVLMEDILHDSKSPQLSTGLL